MFTDVVAKEGDLKKLKADNLYDNNFTIGNVVNCFHYPHYIENELIKGTQINFPTYILAGKQDLLTNYKDLIDLKNKISESSSEASCSFYTFEEARHAPHTDEPLKDFTENLVGFITSS